MKIASSGVEHAAPRRLWVPRPLCIDLFCGLGGWAEGFLAEGYDVVGFDIERHDYGTGGYPGQLVLQDVLTLHGSQFRNAAVIVASPPCQFFSRMAMPFKMPWNEGEYNRRRNLALSLFNACFRIARGGWRASRCGECEGVSEVDRIREVALWQFLSVGRCAGAYAAQFGFEKHRRVMVRST